MKKPPYESDVATQVRKLTTEVHRLRKELRDCLREPREATEPRADEQPRPSKDDTVH
jgi:hypothetical protein